ncbi:MAG: radical SAM protein, partial [Chloroflexi bacterium]|nr:radical SAM protein [Chloroflexota bacterium]
MTAGARRALLINPPLYDTQYWPRWSQPHGLLKVAAWLRRQGYADLRLLDCLATDARRRVAFRRREIVRRDDISRQMWHFGWPLEKLRHELKRHARGELFHPEEIWITSIMTYWWESTRDVIRLVHEVFDPPRPRIYVGGIYPTLDPEHAETHLAAESDDVVIVPGEICDDAGNSWTDLSLYRDEVYPVRPVYAIITGSRGCPFNCAYCAQLKLNSSTEGGDRRVRHRDAQDIAEEIAQKHRDHDIREIAFYEDNLLFNREEFLARLEAIERLGLKLEVYAPEGIEPRLIERELLTRMRRAGFRKIHLALETIDDSISRRWNRRQASIEQFDEAVAVARECGFRVGAQELNAFVIFGLPDEDLQAVVNTALYASHRV